MIETSGYTENSHFLILKLKQNGNVNLIHEHSVRHFPQYEWENVIKNKIESNDIVLWK